MHPRAAGRAPVLVLSQRSRMDDPSSRAATPSCGGGPQLIAQLDSTRDGPDHLPGSSCDRRTLACQSVIELFMRQWTGRPPKPQGRGRHQVPTAHLLLNSRLRSRTQAAVGQAHRPDAAIRVVGERAVGLPPRRNKPPVGKLHKVGLQVPRVSRPRRHTMRSNEASLGAATPPRLCLVSASLPG